MQALADGVVAGDSVALGVVAAAGGYLGAGLANLVNTVNPERIVLAGWVSDLLGDAFLEAARPGVEHQALARPLQSVTMTRLTRPGNAVGVRCCHLRPGGVLVAGAHRGLALGVPRARRPVGGSSSGVVQSAFRGQRRRSASVGQRSSGSAGQQLLAAVVLAGQSFGVTATTVGDDGGEDVLGVDAGGRRRRDVRQHRAQQALAQLVRVRQE